MPAGEDDVALAEGFAANVQVASAEPQHVDPLPDRVSGELHTPGAATIEALAAQLGVPQGNLLKAFPIVTESRGLVLLLIRGDHRVQEIKLTNALGEEFRQAEPDELEAAGLVALHGPARRRARPPRRRGDAGAT